ncbi:MAG: homoserine kinase [Melioribacteraceae bacterium]|nr:homoserine kinase [Melioribacteraceae bacterium]
MKRIKVIAPATISNVGPGFDIMGFALDKPGDEVDASISKGTKIRIKKIIGDGKRLPYDPLKNTATASIISLLKSLDIKVGLDVVIKKNMGIGSGLGSSAASSVAGVFAVNKLLNLKLPKSELLKHALNGEIISSGTLHADNVAPCLFGGFVLIRSYDPLDIIKIDYPKNLFCTVIYPQIEIKTSEARKILDKKVTREVAISQAGNASGLIAGLLTRDVDLISRSMKDFIAEPKRAKLIPCYNEVRIAALANGAINCNISGSGPSMFSFSTSERDAKRIASAMKEAALSKGLKSVSYISKINRRGPVVIK